MRNEVQIAETKVGDQ